MNKRSKLIVCGIAVIAVLCMAYRSFFMVRQMNVK